ncbi:mechanosensitive ion channel family protein [Candidatus Cyanaurora vandensis]|nr:mechanosensitive ion channel family protein [Candidatus Cyanaurora vandensis]
MVACIWMAGVLAQPVPRPSQDTYPVRLGEETLFVLKGKVGSITPAERAEIVAGRVRVLAGDEVALDDLKVVDYNTTSELVLGNATIAAFTDSDVVGTGQSRQRIASEAALTLKAAVERYRSERRPAALLFGLLSTALATLIALVAFWVLARLTATLHTKIQASGLALRVQDYELLSIARVQTLLQALTRTAQLLLGFGMLYLYGTLVLSFFPNTRQLGSKIWANFYGALAAAASAGAAYLPNLLVIVLILIATYYIVRLSNALFAALAQGSLTIRGFYPEWARPTEKLVGFFAIALALAVILPFLPGFNSPAFQGVSVFLGLVLSLSSSAAVSNIVAGVILIYTRAFAVGDRIQIGEAVGDVVDKTLLVTRLRTVNNVVVSLPNATVLSSNIINYSVAARDYGVPLILSTTVTLGYDIPWRKIHAVLVAAANCTEHVLLDPPPFVRQTALNDYYVAYDLNAFTDAPALMTKTYSQLHQNIQDKCNEAGIEILSPAYTALRDGNSSTIPKHDA